MKKATKKKQLSPMLQQYLDYKKTYTDAFLFFQVGDFYELFFEDARAVAAELNLTLTSRDKSAADPIPMCGVPMGAVEGYLSRLVEAGHSVAVVSQEIVPPGFKGMVPRFLERVITPGVQLLGGEQGAHGTVAAVFLETKTRVWVASTDIQSGIVRIDDGVRLENLVDVLESRLVSEVVLYGGSSRIDRRNSELRIIERRINNRIKWRHESYLQDGDFSSIDGFPFCAPEVKKVVRLLLNYLEETTIDVAASGLQIQRGNTDECLVIDATTRANLELDRNLRTQRKEGSLWGALDETVTVAGSRRLRERLCMPFATPEPVLERLQSVRVLYDEEHTRYEIRKLLSATSDVGRIATRIALKVVQPGELADLTRSLESLVSVRHLLQEKQSLLATIRQDLGLETEALTLLKKYIDPDMSGTLKEGGVIRTGVNDEVDRLRQLADGGKSWFESFAQEQRELTGITSLKVKFNQVLGYFIEVTKANADKVPPSYEPRQNTTNARRFVVPELKQAEAEYFGARSRLVELERALFQELVEQLDVHVGTLRIVAGALAELDVVSTAAEVACRTGLTEPELVEGRTEIVAGRHPVLAEELGQNYVPNSLVMDRENGNRLLIVTGPNMGGKSTYLRQAALITVMAQAGWFVPAEKAEIELVDRVFARLGASDNLLEGESTFMVEMREAATIVSNATERSLVVIDEIGRGTSTTDGVALAQAILEWIAEKSRCYCLFATHYHQLCQLADNPHFAGAIANVSVGSTSVEGAVVFTHKIVEGAASRSYGLEVAGLAGLPEELLGRASTILESNGPEKKHIEKKQNSMSVQEQQSLFSAETYKTRTECKELVDLREWRERLAGINPDDYSPRQALDLVYKIAEELKANGS